MSDFLRISVPRSHGCALCPPTGPPYRAPYRGEGTGPHAATKIGVIGLRALEDPGWLAGFGWLDFQSFRLDFGLLFFVGLA